VSGGLALGGFLSLTDPEQLTERCRIRAGLVDLYRPSASDALLDDQSAVGESIDFAHHGGGINVECPGEVGQRASLRLVEEQFDQETSLRIASKHRNWTSVLHNTQYILRETQNKQVFALRSILGGDIG
jgi:hypothetical protein